MKTINSKYVSWSGILIVILVALLGCASFLQTKPNSPYQGPGYPASFSELRQKNPLLASELGKLPEIQDGISSKEAAALEAIAALYNSAPASFDSAFEQMYKVGLPEVRKYCSPLQALFWLAEDAKLSIENNILVNYSLARLLDDAWQLDDKFLLLSEMGARQVVEGIENEDYRNWYSRAILKPDQKERTFRLLLLDFKNNPEMFSEEARKIIRDTLRENLRWMHFGTVIARLNAPELIDYYERNNFSYQYYRGEYKTNKSVFESKRANCYDTTEFTVECLFRAGYKSGNIAVDLGEGHNICYFWDKGKLFLMDNGTPNPRGIMGPYESFGETPFTIRRFVI